MQANRLYAPPVSLGGLNGPKGPGHRWPSYPNLPPLPEPLQLRTSQICLPSDQSGELISDMSILRTQSDVVQSATTPHVFLNETHSKGLHSPADFKSDFIPFLFLFFIFFLIAMVAYSGHPMQCISRIRSIPIVSQLQK